MDCFKIDRPDRRNCTMALVIALLVFETGCFDRKTVVRMEPPPAGNPNIELPVQADIRLRGTTSLTGRGGKKTVRMKTDSLSGEVTAWDKNELKVQSRYFLQKLTFMVPRNEIERIEIATASPGENEFMRGLLTGTLVTTVVVVLVGAAMAAMEINMGPEFFK